MEGTNSCALCNNKYKLADKTDVISDFVTIFYSKVKNNQFTQGNIIKMHSILRMTMRNFQTLSADSFISLYKSLVKPCKVHADIEWSPQRIHMWKSKKRFSGWKKTSRQNTSITDKLENVKMPTTKNRRLTVDRRDTKLSVVCIW